MVEEQSACISFFPVDDECTVDNVNVCQVCAEEPMTSTPVSAPVRSMAHVVASTGAPGGKSKAPSPAVKLNGRRLVKLPKEMVSEILDQIDDVSCPKDAGLTDAHFHMDEAVAAFNQGKEVQPC